MFKRPIVLKGRKPQLEFVTRTVNGALVSTWEPKNTVSIIPTGTPGRVGEIVTEMHKGYNFTPRPPKPFRPHYFDSEFYARKIFETEEEQQAYIFKCKEYYANLPVKPVVVVAEKPTINVKMIADYWRRRKTMPPLEDRVKLLQAAGYPEDRVQKYIKYYEKEAEMSAENQKKIDKIFGSFAVVKPKQKKVIKPVKKKVT